MIYVYDRAAGQWLTSDAPPGEPIPCTKRKKLSLSAFSGACKYGVVWSDLEALNALELLLLYAAPEQLRYAFRRVGEGAHTGQSAHYAGLAFHIGHRLTPDQQMRLIRLALDVCGFDRVEPAFLTPGWVHVEKQIAPPAGLSGGYPALREGDKGVHVMLLQDVLNLNGFGVDALSGCFSSATERDVRHFQHAAHLPVTGRVDGATWNALMHLPGCNPQKAGSAGNTKAGPAVYM